jgi:nicotinamide mononucleotide transporter
VTFAPRLSGWEAAAVALAIAYLVLAIRQNRWCWPAAITSSAIYVMLMYWARLYLESALQVFYVAAAIYGWWYWRPAIGAGVAAGGPPVTTWPWRRHLVALTAIACAALVSASLLRRYTPAALPLLDSLTSFGSLFATWLVARKILENWYYWFVIDAVSVYIYLVRGLVPTAGLYALYLVMIVIGFRDWRRSIAGQGG